MLSTCSGMKLIGPIFEDEIFVIIIKCFVQKVLGTDYKIVIKLTILFLLE